MLIIIITLHRTHTHTLPPLTHQPETAIKDWNEFSVFWFYRQRILFGFESTSSISETDEILWNTHIDSVQMRSLVWRLREREKFLFCFETLNNIKVPVASSDPNHDLGSSDVVWVHLTGSALPVRGFPVKEKCLGGGVSCQRHVSIGMKSQEDKHSHQYSVRTSTLKRLYYVELWSAHILFSIYSVHIFFIFVAPFLC